MSNDTSMVLGYEATVCLINYLEEFDTSKNNFTVSMGERADTAIPRMATKLRELAHTSRFIHFHVTKAEATAPSIVISGNTLYTLTKILKGVMLL